MKDFHLDAATVHDLRERGRELARANLATLAARLRHGDGLEPEEMAALWYASEIDSETMRELALEAREGRPVPLETFAPLYLTNTCDAECRMCGMRRDNRALQRQTTDTDGVTRQLETLVARGMHAVAILTGEYQSERRPWAIAYVNRALRETQELRFGHVLINAGSFDDEEFDALLEGVARHADGAVAPKLTMCTFQETYCRETYARFMGSNPENPRADFDRRLANFDRAYRAGMRVANPGILVGLNPDLGFELTALAMHARHLLALGMEVYLSVPRLRQIAGGRSKGGVSDADFIRLVSVLSLGLPECKIVVTTRENSDIQHNLAPIVTVISAGSAAVAPYTASGALFPLEASQFEVIDQRPFEEILREHADRRGPIENFGG